MPLRTDGQKPVGADIPNSNGGKVASAEENSDGSHKGIPVSKVGKVSRKSTAPEEGYSDKPDTLIENRDIKEEESNTRLSGRNSAARQRRRERNRNLENREKALSSQGPNNRGEDIRGKRASVAEDLGISDDESIDSPPPSRKASIREREYDSGIDTDTSSLNDWEAPEKESAVLSKTSTHSPDIKKGRPLPALPKTKKPETTQPKKQSPTPAPRKSLQRGQAPDTVKGEAVQRTNSDPVSKAASSVSRTETHTEKEVAAQQANSDDDIQTSSHPDQDKLLKQCQRLAETVEDLDEYKGSNKSVHLGELERLETAHAENLEVDDSALEHYLTHDKTAVGIRRERKKFKPTSEAAKYKMSLFLKSARKFWQSEFLPRAKGEKRKLHPVRQKREAPEMDHVMEKVLGEYGGAVKLSEKLESEVALSPGGKYAAAKKEFLDKLHSSQWAKERMEEVLPLQQRLQTLKAALFEELAIEGHKDIEELVDPHIRDSAYVSALEAAFETIDMMPFKARRHLEKHPALQKHLKELHDKEDPDVLERMEHPDVLEYMDKLDDMERLSDKEYLEKLKHLRDIQYIRGFSGEFRLKWLAKHLSQTFRRYSNNTIDDPAFRKNMKGILDTLNARERDIGRTLKPREEAFEEWCEELGAVRKELIEAKETYEESGEEGVDILRQRKVLARAKELKESMVPVLDQIKLVADYKKPDWQGAILAEELDGLGKQMVSVTKLIRKCEEKLADPEIKDKSRDKTQEKKKQLERQHADLEKQYAEVEGEYTTFRKAYNEYKKIEFNMDIKLVNSYPRSPKEKHKSLKKECSALDKEHASLKKDIKKCQEKLKKAEHKGESLEEIQDTLEELQQQYADTERQLADLKKQHEELGQALKGELGQALKRLKKVHWVMDGGDPMEMDDDE
ncbi:hypothetical protein [Endozoicomonas atrinae]|uniref:hypothetical protein n=1 Tax=Endozoicomonas atrinae TaxID=1333660 RepID=UPI000825952B|nr:hypothetical protein [Endozoicomonas atrinae]